jgi:hypothetical protein
MEDNPAHPAAEINIRQHAAARSIRPFLFIELLLFRVVVLSGNAKLSQSLRKKWCDYSVFIHHLGNDRPPPAQPRH